MYNIRSNGKLLLTGEYFVLDGALAFALPTKYGQTLRIQASEQKGLIWKSYTVEGTCWFEGKYSLPDLKILKSTDDKTAQNLQNILLKAREMNPDFLKHPKALKAETHLEFPRDWGLGSSSTLIHSIAKWAEVNPFELSNETMGGSGYDIACAGMDKPIFYQRKPKRLVQAIDFHPSFHKNLYFVHLGKKQNSREGIKQYRSKGAQLLEQLPVITNISQSIVEAKDYASFEQLILEHEKVIARTLEIPRAKTLYFRDFWGEIKSLGAWGGDFVLATSQEGEALTRQYFYDRGFLTVLSYKEMILVPPTRGIEGA